MSTVILGQLSPFNGRSLVDWNRWTERFDQFCILNDVPEDKRVPLLLTTIGQRMYDTLHRAAYPLLLSGMSVERIQRLAQNYFRPSAQMHVFRQRLATRERKPNESMLVFMEELRSLVQACDYGDDEVEKVILDNFLRGLNHPALKAFLLMQEDLSLKKTRTLIAAFEASRTDSALQGHTGVDQLLPIPENSATCVIKEETPKELFQVRLPRRSYCAAGRNTRFRGPSRNKYALPFNKQSPIPSSGDDCGSASATSSDLRNRSRPDVQCYNCGGPHFRRNCPLLRRRPRPFSSTPTSTPVFTQRDVPVNVQQTDRQPDENCYALFQVSPVIAHSPPLEIEVHVGLVPVIFQIDTGAEASVINKKQFNQLNSLTVGLKLFSTDVKLKGYSSSPLTMKIAGLCPLGIKVDDQSVELPVLVVEGDGPNLLGRDAIKVFGLHKLLKMVKFDIFNVQAQANTSQVQTKLAILLDSFKEIFSPELGVYTGDPIELRLIKDAIPRFYRPRPVPLPYRAKVEKEIDRLVQEGIFKPINFSEWATPLVIVKKPDGGLRLCGDYRSTINAFIEPHLYPLPKVDDLLAQLSNTKVFSTLDLRQAYQQVPLTETSANLVAVNTIKGLMAVQRLPFGTVPSSGLFQCIIENLLCDIPFVKTYQDDILVATPDLEAHWAALQAVFTRLRNAGLRLKKEKCKFVQAQIKYLGFNLSQEGISPLRERIEAIIDIRPPTDVTQVKSFLGLVNFYGRFIPALAQAAAPLYDLTRNGCQWQWSSCHQLAFQTIKDKLTTAPTLKMYDVNSPVIIACDASPVGVAAVLAQPDNKGNEWPVAYASRVLSSTQRRYAHIDKEAYAIIFALQRFYQYICGKKLIIYTDHKPLLGIFGTNKPIPNIISPRLLRWSLKLSAYNYELRHRPGEVNCNADALSRHPVGTPQDEETDVQLNMLDIHNEGLLTLSEIQEATIKDAQLSKLQLALHTTLENMDLGMDLQDYKQYLQSVDLQDGLLLLGHRVIIPYELRPKCLQLLHLGHPGISAMKARAGGYMWWPRINHDIIQLVNQCQVCQAHSPAPNRSVPVAWPRAMNPWQRIHMDFAGPIKNYMILVLVDAYSGWIHATPLRVASSVAVISVLRELFAMFGLPEVVVSDNAPNFKSSEMEEFLKANHVQHLYSPPYHPQSNGPAERAVRWIKERLNKFQQGTIQQRISRVLFFQHYMPKSRDKLSAAEKFLGRSIRTHLDAVFHPPVAPDIATPEVKRSYDIGDFVWIESFNSRRDRWVPARVIQKSGSVVYQVRELNSSRDQTRHLNHIRPRIHDKDENTQVSQVHKDSVDEALQKSDDKGACEDEGNQDKALLKVVRPASQKTDIRTDVSLSDSSSSDQLEAVTTPSIARVSAIQPREELFPRGLESTPSVETVMETPQVFTSTVSGVKLRASKRNPKPPDRYTPN